MSMHHDYAFFEPHFKYKLDGCVPAASLHPLRQSHFTNFPFFGMHSPAIDGSSYGQMNGNDVMNNTQYAQNMQMNHSNGADSARSNSRSTEGTDTSEQGGSNATEAVQVPPQAATQQQQQQQQQPVHLGMALHHATGIEPPTGTANFPPFNPAGNQFDLFGFQNNSLLQYPNMLQQFRNGGGFDTKPDLQTIQSQMQMREAKPYKCTQCIKSFANSSYLSQHMRIHLGIKPFGPCQYCGKKFTQLSHLQQHIRTHTGEKPYKCKYQGCEKAFSQLSNLQSHSRCHQTDKPFKCNSCYKCFADEQSLLEHIPKHKESKHLKVHICPFCGKSYTQATYLQKHMTKHADRTRGMRYPGATEFQAEGLNLEAWNTLPPTMPEDPNALAQFNQFNASMMSTVAASTGQAQTTAAGYPQALNPSVQDFSAFHQLLNFQRHNSRGYLDYQTNFSAAKQPTAERSAGFNMITPLENIQRYTQQGATATTTTAHQQFQPNIINTMKPTSY